MKRNIETYNRYFSFILYEEDKEQMKGMEYLIRNYPYARIKHDKDKEEDGTIKKEHYHIIIYVGQNPRNRKAISKETNIKENYIEGCNKDNMLLYLIHYNNPEKTQYDIEEVDGELAKELYKLIESRTQYQRDKLKEIIKYINKNQYNTIENVTIFSIDNNYYEVLKQNQYLITKIIQERNTNYVNKRYFKNNTTNNDRG